MMNFFKCLFLTELTSSNILYIYILIHIIQIFMLNYLYEIFQFL